MEPPTYMRSLSDRLPMILASFAFLCTEDDKSFQKMDDSLKGIVGSRCRLIIKTNTAPLWKVFFRWDDTIPEDLIRAAYDRLAGIRYTALMHKLKKKRVQPVYVIDEAWRRYLECGRARTSLPGLVKRRRIGTLRSKALGLDPRSTVNDSSETPPTVNELYLHLHTVNHDRMTFIDTRSERFYAPEEMSGAHLSYTDQSVDDEAVYLNVAGECPKGRVYGLGSLGRKKRRYADPGASTSEMSDMVPRAEFNVVAEQL
ncbi:hypothetical protein Sjap_020186 [Stephania japonica]|uniref:Uncharacterized protein n=1 Tax=Stephania japonica TaxID=461633 RepID=A0AAP0F5Q9_9MAGN